MLLRVCLMTIAPLVRHTTRNNTDCQKEIYNWCRVRGDGRRHCSKHGSQPPAELQVGGRLLLLADVVARLMPASEG